MATRITGEIIESYLNCKYKGHLMNDNCISRPATPRFPEPW